jgi:hypothetical protein
MLRDAWEAMGVTAKTMVASYCDLTQSMGLNQCRESSIWETVKEYQVLLGLLVSAASVAALIWAENRANRRHYELVRKQDNSTKLIVERALTPAYEELCEIDDWATIRIPQIIEDLTQDVDAFDYIVSGTIEAVSRQQFRDAEKLLDGNTAAELRKLRSAANEARDEISGIYNIALKGEKISANLQQRMNVVTREMATSRIEVIAGLERLAKAEKVQLSRPVNKFKLSPDVGLDSTGETR